MEIEHTAAAATTPASAGNGSSTSAPPPAASTSTHPHPAGVADDEPPSKRQRTAPPEATTCQDEQQLHPALDSMLREYFLDESSFDSRLDILIKRGTGPDWWVDLTAARLIARLLELCLRRLLTGQRGTALTLDRLPTMLSRAQITGDLARSVNLETDVAIYAADAVASSTPNPDLERMARFFTLPPMVWPSDLSDSIDGPAGVILTAILEALASQILRFAKLRVDGQRRTIRDTDVRKAITRNVELLEMARGDIEWMPAPPEPHPAIEAMLSDYLASPALADGLRALLQWATNVESWSLDPIAERLIIAVLRAFLRRLLNEDATALPITLDRVPALVTRTRLTGSLATEATASARLALDNYAQAKAIDPSRSDLAAMAGLRLPLLCWPIELPDSADEPISIIVTRLMEGWISQLFSRATYWRLPGGNVLRATHLRAAIFDNNELRHMARGDFESILSMPRADQFSKVRDAVVWTEMYPRTHAWYQARVKESAWYHQPDQVEAVLQRYLTGELTPGHPHYMRRFNIRPVAHYGSSRVPLLTAHRYQDDPRAVQACSFDLIDADGREYPCVYEGKSADIFRGMGVICDRRTGVKLVRCLNDSTNEITLFHTAAHVFARYVPHGFTHPNTIEGHFNPKLSGHASEISRSSYFGPMRPRMSGGEYACMDERKTQQLQDWTKCRTDADSIVTEEDARALAKETYAEISMLFSVASRLSESDPDRDIFSFTGLHPPKVVSLFTVAGLQAAFDSVEVRGVWSTRDVNVGMPKELLAIIAEYAPVDLPSLPRSLKPQSFAHSSAPGFHEDDDPLAMEDDSESGLEEVMLEDHEHEEEPEPEPETGNGIESE